MPRSAINLEALRAAAKQDSAGDRQSWFEDTIRTVYRMSRSGTLDTKGRYSAVLSIRHHGRGLASLTVIVQGRSKSVRLSRLYRYSG